MNKKLVLPISAALVGAGLGVGGTAIAATSAHSAKPKTFLGTAHAGNWAPLNTHGEARTQPGLARLVEVNGVCFLEVEQDTYNDSDNQVPFTYSVTLAENGKVTACKTKLG